MATLYLIPREVAEAIVAQLLRDRERLLQRGTPAGECGHAGVSDLIRQDEHVRIGGLHKGHDVAVGQEHV